jgi:3D (Asp-Asp-Asp) domain-containing protein
MVVPVVLLAAAGLTAGLGLAGGGSPPARPRHPATGMVAKRALLARPARAAAHPARRRVASGGGPPASASRCQRPAPPAPEPTVQHPQWIGGVVITEYYPAPERWFVGARISAPGLAGRHAADWLYSARGLAMEGDGIDLAGRPVHIAALGSTGWVNAGGQATLPVCLGKWTDGFPAWLRGGWRNRQGAVTFPLSGGGWSDGAGVRTLDYGGVSFAAGSPLPLRYYHSIAVDPKLIPLGSRVYIPAYRRLGGGWFVAQDIGGAIRGRHVDVYRAPPDSPRDLGRYMTHQRIFVIPPA